MVVANAADALDTLERKAVHTAIVDMDAPGAGGLGVVRMIRGCYPDLPCIMVSRCTEGKVLASALELNVFSVIAKPVDMTILQDQLNRLFRRMYNCAVFA